MIFGMKIIQYFVHSASVAINKRCWTKYIFRVLGRHSFFQGLGLKYFKLIALTWTGVWNSPAFLGLMRPSN
jgi:hypothetical protein